MEDDSSLFPGKVVFCLQSLEAAEDHNMTKQMHNAEYRYFSFTYSFTYFGGKACFGLAERACM